MHLFIQIAHDPSAGALAHRGFLIGAAAVRKGHEVSVFLAGGAVKLLTAEELDRMTAFGHALRSDVETIRDAGGAIFVSGEAAAARGLAPEDLAGACFELPDKIVDLVDAADKTLTYG